MEAEEEGQNRKEENAPVVPRIGAFYMHDDRFGRRITSGRRKLQEFKDEKKWQHDKFEEMTKGYRISDEHNQGYYGHQGRGYHINADQFKPNDNFNGQSYSSRPIKGRGPVKCKPLNSSSYVVPLTRNKESRKPPGMNSNINSTILLSHASEIGSDSLISKSKKMYHHASSSNPGICVPKKRDVQPRKTEGYLPGEDVRLPCPNAHLKGKDVSRYNVESLQLIISHLSLTSSDQDDNFSSMRYHPAEQISPESPVYYPSQVYNHQFSSHYEIAPQSSFIAPSPSGSDFVVVASSRKSEMAWSGRGIGTAQGCGTGSQFGETYGHQNFITTTPLMHTMQVINQLAVGDLIELAAESSAARYMTQIHIGFGDSELTRYAIPKFSFFTVNDSRCRHCKESIQAPKDQASKAS
ncbi:hypothetical protein RCOM_0926520 [Ricinus communis]|uniref:Btz domain-containing protein n=1 Tax=Ricinus communis TaxID=3988 RepID=B9RPB6_RICCO|nr:hypothetical protein RCOM_0926520 [Ricinus communis]